MFEYKQMGNMKLALTKGKYFTPYHGVIKYIGGKIKLRSGFDAFAQSSSQLSLNQLLYVSPKLQQNISDPLTQGRLSIYFFTADICKMYRQILVLPPDHHYQHILWRDSPNH